MPDRTSSNKPARRTNEKRDAEAEAKPRRADELDYEHQEEIGATSGRKHADVLEQTLPHDLARKSALRGQRYDRES